MAIEPLETLLAHKVISLMTNLSRSYKAIAGTLIDHYNRKTGRCDPSIERIARLNGVHRRTVLRAIAKFDELDLFRRQRHGGRWSCNSYEPNWNRFHEIHADWQARFGLKEGGRQKTKPPSSRGRLCHLSGDSSVTQTYPNNLTNRTYSKWRSGNQIEKGFQFSGHAPKPPIKATLSRDVARDAAERRWSQAFNARYLKVPALFILMTEAITSEWQQQITDAELHRPGSGLAMIIDRIEPDVAARDRKASI